MCSTFATAMWALRYGETWGSTCGFTLGLAADLDAAHWLGRHALVLALMGYAVGRLSRTLVRDSARTQFVVLFSCTFLHQAWSAAFELGGAAGLALSQRARDRRFGSQRRTRYAVARAGPRRHRSSAVRTCSSSTPARRLREGRFRLVAVIVATGFGLVVLGLLKLQVVDHELYSELSKENRVRLEVLRAPRGAIFDRRGELLADSAPSFSILFRPFPTESVSAARQTLSPRWVRRVAELVELDTSDVRHRVRDASRTGQSVIFKRNAPVGDAGRGRGDAQRAARDSKCRSNRFGTIRTARWPRTCSATPVEINEVELDSLADDGYRSGDLIGRTGIEMRYEDLLRGHDGAEFVVVNAMGKRCLDVERGLRRSRRRPDTISTSRSISGCSRRWKTRWRTSSAAPRWRWIRATAAFSRW